MLTKLSEAIRKKPIIGWGLFLAVMVLVFLLGLFAASVTERRAEIASIFNNKKVEISSDTIEARNEIWGLNYPREYETWKHTADMVSEASIRAIWKTMYSKIVPIWLFCGRDTHFRKTIKLLADTCTLWKIREIHCVRDAL